MTKLAVIADVHGNPFALKVVLHDIARRELSQVVNLGDSLDRDMDPAATAELLMSSEVPSIAGNYETFRDHQLTEAQHKWVARLPKTLDLGDIFCCHGTPDSDHDALVEEIDEDGVRLADTETIFRRLGGVGHPVVLCAHKHVPRAVWLPTGQLVVNPGSVGLPAYWHDEPAPHVMEAGSPHARYAVLSKGSAGWDVEHVALAYPWEAATELARASGREDRAGWLETGRASLPIV